MMAYLKKIFGLAEKIEPTDAADQPVNPAPELEQKAKIATTNLVQIVMKNQRSAWEIRDELASGALTLVVDTTRPRGGRNERT